MDPCDSCRGSNPLVSWEQPREDVDESLRLSPGPPDLEVAKDGLPIRRQHVITMFLKGKNKKDVKGIMCLGSI